MSTEGISGLLDHYRRAPDLIDGRLIFVGTEASNRLGSLGQMLKTVTNFQDGDGVLSMAAQLGTHIEIAADRVGRIILTGGDLNHGTQLIDPRIVAAALDHLDDLGPQARVYDMVRGTLHR